MKANVLVTIRLGIRVRAVVNYRCARNASRGIKDTARLIQVLYRYLITDEPLGSGFEIGLIRKSSG